MLPTFPRRCGVTWLEPTVAVEVQYNDLTGGRLRAPVLRGFISGTSIDVVTRRNADGRTCLTVWAHWPPDKAVTCRASRRPAVGSIPRGGERRETPFIGEINEGMTGGSTPQDLETMFQLLYLRFVQPRADTMAFSAMVSQAKGASRESDGESGRRVRSGRERRPEPEQPTATAGDGVAWDAVPMYVFAHVDDIRSLGSHMTKRSSMAMMGSRLRLEIRSDQATGLGATYRYSGTMMGLSIDFSESVTKYVPPREKVWRTLGEPRLLIIASYEMRVVVDALSKASARLTVSIVYELPGSAFWRIVGLLLARPYSRWCLRRMLQDARRALEAPTRVTA